RRISSARDGEEERGAAILLRGQLRLHIESVVEQQADHFSGLRFSNPEVDAGHAAGEVQQVESAAVGHAQQARVCREKLADCLDVKLLDGLDYPRLRHEPHVYASSSKLK